MKGMDDYILTVGLEVHAELATKTKMFCSSKNDTDEKRPNWNVCPVCMGMPGSLPVINKEAVRSVLRLGVAINGDIADYTEFDRKNYFYPDIPKGYQISQYKHPLVSGGELAGVAITRVHLEEDTAKSTHDTGDSSLLDFNRAGVPLMELVTEPVIHDAETAGKFARELQLLMLYLGISHANMEKGEMRVEANISVAKKGATLGKKVEVKNLNSFKSVEKAIRFEFNRHIALLESGREIAQETRGWDEIKEETYSQRVKEDSHDYRYFPDPDLPKLMLSEVPEFNREMLVSSLPELPDAKRRRYKEEFGLKDEDTELLVLDSALGNKFEEIVSSLKDNKLVQISANFLITNPSIIHIDSTRIAEIVAMFSDGKLSSTNAKALFKIAEGDDGSPQEIAERMGLIQSNDTEKLKEVAKDIITANTNAVDEYKAGKEASLQFLIGQGMKATKGSANPQVLKSIFEELLN